MAFSIAGVYRATADSQSEFGDSEITQVAFSKLNKGGRSGLGLRYADGSLQEGICSPEEEHKVTLKLYPNQKGSQGLVRDYTDEVTLEYSTDDSGDVRLSGNGCDAPLTPDPERRYLFDRDFSWEPRTPINR